MKIILLGAPGAGKGTVASLAKETLEIPHISTGDMFRKAMADQTELGTRVKEIMNQGKLVPDTLTNELVEERITNVDCKYGYILDGYPRTVQQAEFLSSIENITKVVLIDVKEDILVKRLSGRMTCPKCGEGYNEFFKAPKKHGICDKCGSVLTKRSDDNETTAKDRIAVYNKQTKPLIKFYKTKKLLVKVDGNQEVEKVLEDFKKALSK